MELNNTHFDVAVIGAGPAGLSAARNAAIRTKRVALFGPEWSEKLRRTQRIENYLGIAPCTGMELLQQFRAQTDPLVLRHATNVHTVYNMGTSFGLLTTEQDLFTADAVVLATGVSWGRAIPGEEEFRGRGAGTCAICDAPLYRGKNVVIVGYYAHAIEEVRFLSEIARSVVFVNRSGVELSVPEGVRVTTARPKMLEGSGYAERLVLENETLEADGFFFLREAVAPSETVPGLVLDGVHVQVNAKMETNLAGVFAAGDVIGKPYQVNAACGSGQIAGLHAAEYAVNVRRMRDHEK